MQGPLRTDAAFRGSTEMFFFIISSAASRKARGVSMRSLIFTKTGEPNGVLKLAEIPTPPLAHGEALVRVLLTPIHPSGPAHGARAMAISRNYRPARALKV